MAIYGISLEMLPGPLLIWLAHDIHRRFGNEHAEAEAEVEEHLRRKRGERRTGASAGPLPQRQLRTRLSISYRFGRSPDRANAESCF